MKVTITRDGLLNDSPVKKGEVWNITDDQFNSTFMEEVTENTSSVDPMEGKTEELSEPMEGQEKPTEETPKEEKPKKAR